MAQQVIGAVALTPPLLYGVCGLWRMWRARRLQSHDDWARMVHQRIRDAEARDGLTVWRTVTYDECERDLTRPGSGTFFAPHVTYELVPCAAVPQLQDELAGRDTSPLVAILRDRARAHEEQMAADVARVQRMLATMAALPSGEGVTA